MTRQDGVVLKKILLRQHVGLAGFLNKSILSYSACKSCWIGKVTPGATDIYNDRLPPPVL